MRYNNPTNLPASVHCFALICFAVVTSLLVCTTQRLDGRVWSGWTESHGLRRPEYSERVQFDAFFRTRANTWSNLAYVLVGCYAFVLGWRDSRLRESSEILYLLQTPALSIAFGVACCYLGVGSGLFHASLTRFGQQLDVAAMYSPLLVLIAINIGRLLPRIDIGKDYQVPTWPLWLLIVGCASWFLFLYKWSMSSTHVLGSLIATMGLTCVHDQMRRHPVLDERWLIASLASLILAVACRQLDIARLFTGPEAWMQGHALWHVLTSVSLACMYFYFRSETQSFNHNTVQ